MNNLNKGGQNRSEIYVKKWVDYSSKYGLGYLLSNGFTGVFFNDSTKIILDIRTKYHNSIIDSTFEYMERRGTEKQDAVDCYSINDYPKDLQKKVTLLQHFRSYLEGETKISPVLHST
jgi:polo-like kinase 1